LERPRDLDKLPVPMGDSKSGPNESVTQVAEESFVRARPIQIERGTVLAGRYQVEDTIGKGGSGIVLRVFDRLAQNVVALKVLKSELAHDGKWERRFSRELRLGRPIQHPNVCRIFDIGEADGHRFLTMELAHGGSLRDELKRPGARDRPVADKLADARAVISGLAALHAAGVVHRDFKPDNLLRMDDGRLVLSDFGLATDTANAPGATVMVGTPHYMAPEVLAGEPATSRSDVWALGVVLHEIFFGQRPERRSVSFDGSERGPLRPSLPVERAILGLSERCLADTPFDRPADAAVVVDLFERIVSSGGTPGRGRRRRPWLLTGMSALTIVGLVLALRHFGGGVRTDRPAASSPGAPLIATGTPIDWSTSAKTISEVPGRVYCFSLADDRTARLVWGTPRRSEEVDIISGARRPSPIAKDTYETGCPQLSPGGKRLLFSGRTQGGASEIRLSDFADGHSPSVITSGDEPVWLTDDSFLYNVDGGHVGVFSVPTMSLTLLADPAVGKQRVIVEKSASRAGDVIALLVGSETSELAVVIYEGRNFEKQSTFAIPAARRIQFSEDDPGQLFLYYQASKSISTLAELDWRRGVVRNVGRYSGFDILQPELARSPDVQAQRLVLLVRRTSSDVWRYDGQRRERLTSSGDVYSAARSSRGELLLSKWAESGDVAIWRQALDGTLKQVTFGSRDVGPRFSDDDQTWAYADYARKSIMICADLSGRCRVLRQDEFLPTSPTFSPGGERLAYLTEVGASKLVIISTKDGTVQGSWDAHNECPPVWSSATTIWSLEAASGRYYWCEHDALTSAKTGKRFEVPGVQSTVGEMQCSPPAISNDSPFVQHERIERAEVSKLLSVEPPPSR
jgi:serine/threonine protein kinase